MYSGMNLPVHIIIPSVELAGVEKRMLSFWFYSQKEYKREIYLVITESLYKKFVEAKEFSEIVNFKNKIILIDSAATRTESLKIVRQHFFTYREKAILHFVLWYPVNFSTKQSKTVYTFPGYDLSYLSMAKKAILYLSFLSAKKIDLLDPIIYKNMKKLFFLKKNSFNLTPNSVVNIEKYKADFASKENWIVFLGRFVQHKQVMPFARAIPLIYKQLKEKNVPNIKFFLLGLGEQENELKSLLAKEEYKGIDIFVGFVFDPQHILEKSKIILSIQQYNNYPSRSLLEAMACGNIPVVTDVGNTDLIAKPGFSAYISKNFTAEEIAGSITGLLALDQASQLDKMRNARQFVADNCRMENMAQYFYNLYDTI